VGEKVIERERGEGGKRAGGGERKRERERVGERETLEYVCVSHGNSSCHCRLHRQSANL